MPRNHTPVASLREWIARLWGTLRPGRHDDDLEQELRSHLELAVEAAQRRDNDDAEPRANNAAQRRNNNDAQPRDNTQGGAVREAAVRHGTMTPTMDVLRDQRGLPWLDDVTRDLRHGARTLRRSPSFAAVVMLTLAIGIGANTAVFSVVNSVLLEPLPYPRAGELVAVWHTAPGASGMSNLSGDLRLSASMYFTYAEQNRTFQDIGVWFANSATITGIGRAGTGAERVGFPTAYCRRSPFNRCSGAGSNRPTRRLEPRER